MIIWGEEERGAGRRGGDDTAGKMPKEDGGMDEDELKKSANGWLDGWMDGWMTGWMDGWMEELW